MKDLPKVFASPINKEINNEQKYYRSDEKNSSVSIYDIDKVLNSNKYLFRSKVKINGEIKTVIKRVNNYLLTIDNEKININDIKKIELL